MLCTYSVSGPRGLRRGGARVAQSTVLSCSLNLIRWGVGGIDAFTVDGRAICVNTDELLSALSWTIKERKRF